MNRISDPGAGAQRLAPPPSERRRNPPRSRVLFVSEAVTLAQIVRLAVLAAALDPRRYEVHFASAETPGAVFGESAFVRWPLDTVTKEHIEDALASGRPLYDHATLARYVDSDRAVIEAVRPDLIVGDFRWSLAVSAPLSGVPFATLVNAYWSPHARREGFPLPEHPIVRALGVPMASRWFPYALPAVFRHFARPLNRLRRSHGLSPIGDLLDVLNFGTYTLYADTPSIAPTTTLLPSHRYLGPVLWSPKGSLPPEWGRDSGRPAVYITLGSSGDVRCLPTIVRAVGELPVDVLLATAGRARLNDLPPNVRTADFVPGGLAARRAELVVTNGGSCSSYQALAEGTPVLGIPSNFDQYLSASAIGDSGAGIFLRAGTLTEHGMRDAVSRTLGSEQMRRAARQVARDFATYRAGETFCRFVDEAIGSAKPQRTVGNALAAPLRKSADRPLAEPGTPL